MALIRCPECGREVSDQAASCPSCGYPLATAAGSRPAEPGGPARPLSYEYKSKKTILGLPLVHIVYGPVWAVGLKPARGIIAIGNFAVGVIAIGGFAVGIFAFAGIGLGLVCVAGMAFGIGAGVGGIATGYVAIGGIAIGSYAIGGLAVGPHTIYNDPRLRDIIRGLFHFKS
jgi:hypothetical protein